MNLIQNLRSIVLKYNYLTSMSLFILSLLLSSDFEMLTVVGKKRIVRNPSIHLYTDIRLFFDGIHNVRCWGIYGIQLHKRGSMDATNED